MYEMYTKHWTTLKKLIYLRAAVGGGTEEYTGDIVQFETARSKKLKNLIVSLSPIQDLHGYDSPWPAGGGKNKLPITITTITTSDVTFTVSDDGTISLSGTASASINQVINSTTKLITGTSYKISGCAEGSDGSNYYLRSTRGIIAGSNTPTFGTPATATDEALYLFIHIESGVNTNGLVFKPMICLASETDSTFAPYSNHCPITGRTGASAYVNGVNQWDEEWEVGDIDRTTGQNAYSSTQIRSKNYIDVLPSTQYYIRADASGDANVAILYYDGGKNFISAQWGINLVRTTPANCHFIRFTSNGNYGATYKNDISINYPSTDTDYQAYSGNLFSVEFPALGANKLPPASVIESKTSGDVTVTSYADGHYHILKESGSTSSTVTFDLATTAEALAGMFFVPKCTTQNGSVTIGIRDADNTIIKEVYLGNGNPSAIGTTGTASKLAVFVHGSVASIDADVYPMLVEDKTIQWEPYTNTVYSGTGDIVTGVLTADMAMAAAFSGGSWTMETTLNGNVFSRSAILGKAMNYNFICNKYKNVRTYRTNLVNGEIGCYNNTNGLNRFSICDNRFSTVEDFVASLSDIEVVYELATPITFQLTPQEVMSLVGQNVVWSEDGKVTVRV